MKKGALVTVQFGHGVRYGMIVSTEVFNLPVHRLFFVPADRKRKEVGLEVQMGEYVFQPDKLMSINDKLHITEAGVADPTVTEDVCKRIRLIMDLG
jgi:hypothetical protein